MIATSQPQINRDIFNWALKKSSKQEAENTGTICSHYNILCRKEENPLNNGIKTKWWNADGLTSNTFPTPVLSSSFSSTTRLPLSESSEQWSVTGVNKRKKNLINVSKFQIVRSQTEWKHTGHEENYSHFPEWLVKQVLHKNGSSTVFLKMTWSSKNCPSCLDRQLRWKALKHLKHLIHCLLSVLSFTITLCLFITPNC